MVRSGTALLFVLIACGIARGAPVSFSSQPSQQILLENAGARWTVTNKGGTDNGFPGTTVPGTAANGSPGLTVEDAEIIGVLSANDAFDNGLEIWIGSSIFVSPDTVDVTDQTLTAGPVVMSNLGVTVQYAALATLRPTLRVLVTLRNSSSTPVSTGLALLSNLGSDADTVVMLTSDGDTTVEDGDRFLITADDPVTPTDAVVTHVIGGPSFTGHANGQINPSRRPGVGQVVFNAAGDPNGVRVEHFPITVPPQSTLVVLFFSQLNETISGAISAVNAFGNEIIGIGQPPIQPNDDLLSGISADTLTRVLNWNFFNWYDLAGGGAFWTVSNRSGTFEGGPTGSACTRSTAGLGVFDAIVGTHADAFDQGLVLYVDDAVLVPPLGPTVDERTLSTGAVRMSGLDVTVQYAAATESPTLRTLASFTNPGASDVTANVKLVSNFGSDEDTGIRATSSGDTTLAGDDRWLVTSDNPATPVDAVNIHAFAGPEAPLPPAGVSSTVFECGSDTNGILSEFPLTVPAGQTRRLLFFHALAETNEAGVAAAAAFDTTPSASDDLLAGVSAADLFEVVNWDFCASEAAQCDDGDGCTDDSCSVGPGCAHALVARAAAFVPIQCRTDALAASVEVDVPAGRLHTALVRKLQVARVQEDKAEIYYDAGRAGPGRRALTKAIKLLRGFEAALRKNKARRTLTAEQRAAFTQTSSDLRADLQAVRALNP